MVLEHLVHLILAIAIFFAVCLYARRIKADPAFEGLPSPDGRVVLELPQRDA